MSLDEQCDAIIPQSCLEGHSATSRPRRPPRRYCVATVFPWFVSVRYADRMHEVALRDVAKVDEVTAAGGRPRHCALSFSATPCSTRCSSPSDEWRRKRPAPLAPGSYSGEPAQQGERDSPSPCRPDRSRGPGRGARALRSPPSLQACACRWASVARHLASVHVDRSAAWLDLSVALIPCAAL